MILLELLLDLLGELVAPERDSDRGFGSWIAIILLIAAGAGALYSLGRPT
jgi:hypothetical protein